MDYSTSELLAKTGLSNKTLQTWLSRHRVEFSGGGEPGHYRRFPLATVAQLAVTKLVRDSSTFPVKRALEVGKVFAEYRDDVRIHDEVILVVTKNDVVIGPRGHRRFFDENQIPISGMYFYLTDLHRELHGPHQPRDPETPNERRERLGFDVIPDGLQAVKGHFRGSVE